jgi:hypothetical protein
VTETSRDTLPPQLSDEAPTVPYWTRVSGNGQFWEPAHGPEPWGTAGGTVEAADRLGLR